ncbi:DJ-1/PfpI family protein [bacterium]|nr:DJ-1/PfpI family protein [bacterium]
MSLSSAKNLIFIGIIVILIVGGVLIYQNLKKEKTIPQKEKIIMPEKTLGNKKVVMIVAFRDFRDEEYFIPKEILLAAGAEVKTASNQKGKAIGAGGGEAEVDLLVSNINPEEFDAVVFVGGPGCLENLDNDVSYKVIKDTVSQNKVLGAICISPVILAKAGVLEGKEATVWSSPMYKSPINILEENGANYTGESVEVDGKIVTANGPAAAKEFGEKLVEVLTPTP